MKTEVLAPAGSKEGLFAALSAGADAVYTGGRMFGARAYADNLSDEELSECIDYCHLHGKRLYLTVNTLMKEKELISLVNWLVPLYETGLDAVIVQDLGTFLELEMVISEEESREEALQEIDRVLQKLGYKQKDTTRTSYLSMLQRMEDD